MKKILLSLSALSLGATPAVTLLHVSEKQVITNVTKEIQQKIDETSQLFKAPIITNAQKTNSGVVNNWLNDQNISDISGIDSKLSYKEFNEQVYDSKQANTQLKKIYKQPGYVHKNDDASKELILNTASSGVSLLEKSVDKNGLKPNGINEFLNWISYVSAVSGSTIKADKFDSSILSFGDKISFIKAFKKFPAPTYRQLQSEGVKTNKGLKFYTLSSLNYFISTNFGLTSESNAWDFKIDESSTTIEQDFFNASSVMFKEIFSKGDNKESLHKFKFDASSIKYLMNFIYSLSWYIENFEQLEYKPEISSITDQNHIFSLEKTNIEVMNEIYSKNINKSIIDSKTLNGLFQILYDMINSQEDKSSYKASRTLKILFQVDDDINDGNTNLNFDKKVIKMNKSLLVNVNIGEWKNNSTSINGLFNPLFSSIGKGFLDTQISGSIGGLLKILGLSTDNLGSILGGLISSVLSGIDMTYFFTEMPSMLDTSLKNMYSWGPFGSIGAPIKSELEPVLENLTKQLDPDATLEKKQTWANKFTIVLNEKIIKPLNEKEIFNNLFNKILNQKGYINVLLKLFNIKLPFDLSNKSLKDIFSMNLLGISLGDVIIKILKNINNLIPEVYKVLALLASIVSEDAVTKYEFYLKRGTAETETDLKTILGYEREDGRVSDIALAWSMMKFVKDENGKNAVVGIRPTGSNEQILYGHKAWKSILGLDYESMTFIDSSILYWLNETLTSGITGKIVSMPIKFARQYIDSNLATIDYNRNKLMSYWIKPELFKTTLISYEETNSKESLDYIITYKVKKDVYNTYEVSVEKNKTSNVKYNLIKFKLI